MLFIKQSNLANAIKIQTHLKKRLAYMTQLQELSVIQILMFKQHFKSFLIVSNENSYLLSDKSK